MAALVCIVGVTHIPFYSRMTAGPPESWPPIVGEMVAENAAAAKRLAAARPDTLLTIAHDHLNQFFMDNMPAFAIGTMDRYDGTFNHEARQYGLPRVELSGDQPLARAILQGGLDGGIDFAYSSEMKVDHSVVVPLLMLRPGLDLPIVPILSNCIAPPIPSSRRFHEVGSALRRILEGIPGQRRVGVVVSGHLSLEVGGPAQLVPGAPDPPFDARAARWIAEAAVDEAIVSCDFEKLLESGNLSHGFLNFLLALGLAGDRKPDYVKVVDTPRGASPYFIWDGAA
jgi:protocatechuate 4,5-dioxygenase beta chain